MQVPVRDEYCLKTSKGVGPVSRKTSIIPLSDIQCTSVRDLFFCLAATGPIWVTVSWKRNRMNVWKMSLYSTATIHMGVTICFCIMLLTYTDFTAKTGGRELPLRSPELCLHLTIPESFVKYDIQPWFVAYLSCRLCVDLHQCFWGIQPKNAKSPAQFVGQEIRYWTINAHFVMYFISIDIQVIKTISIPITETHKKDYQFLSQIHF